MGFLSEGNLLNKTIKRVIVVLLSVIVLVILTVAISIHAFGNRAIRFSIIAVGTHTLKVDVELEDVSFSIIGGWLKLKNLKIGNPPDYAHENLLELDNGKVDLNIKSLTTDTVIISNLHLDGLSLVIEQKDLVRGNNLQDILKDLPSPDADKTEPAPAGRKLHIDKLLVTNVHVKAKLLPIPGRADTVELTLAPIEMTDLGQDDKMTSAMLVSRIFRAIAEGIAVKGKDLLPKEILDPMISLLEKPTEIITETGKGLIEGGKDIQEGLTEGLKGLLPSKKEE